MYLPILTSPSSRVRVHHRRVVIFRSLPENSETVNISEDDATALLRYFSWNRERLFDQVMRRPNVVSFALRSSQSL